LNAQQISHRRLQLKIRRLTVQDLGTVMAIEPIAFGTHHWSRQSFENELSNAIGYYFAGIDGNSDELVGYSGFWLIDGNEAHITTLAVHPSFRRQYVGERLLINNILDARSRGARRMTLEVRVSNEQAQNLYQKYGFKNLGMRRNYYQDNSEDALVLWTDNIETPQFNKLLENRMAVLEPFVLTGAPEPLPQPSKSK
jgi:[ribosomal protein S18]-alanine N-acetyltransferase